MIFIVQGFRTIVFIFTGIFTTLYSQCFGRYFLRTSSEEGRRTYRPKRCEDNSPKTLNDKMFFWYGALWESVIFACYLSKVGDHSRGWPEGSLFDSLLHQGVGEGATPFPGLLNFTLDPYLIMLSVKQGRIKYHFWVFGMTRPGIEPRSPGPMANTLTARPIVVLILLCLR